MTQINSSIYQRAEHNVEQWGNTFVGKVKHSCRTQGSTNMHLTNQFRPAFRFPSLHFAGQMNKMLWLWKLAQEDDKHCACRDLCPDVARNYFRCNYNGHILRNGSTDSGRQQRQRHMACGDRQDDVNRRANPLANWYLLLLKCPKLVDTFHLVFQTLIHPASHSK